MYLKTDLMQALLSLFQWIPLYRYGNVSIKIILRGQNIWITLSLHRATWNKCFTFTNRWTYLLVLDSTKIYIKIHIKMFLHVSAYDHHQGARAWA